MVQGVQGVQGVLETLSMLHRPRPHGAGGARDTENDAQAEITC